MNKCIYTLKTDTETTFNSCEHIFPCSIGGVNKLDKGWVSDEFNNEISKAEREFLRKYVLIILPRMFDGPDGRKGHKGKIGVSFMKERDTDNVKLGYIERGIPAIMPQIIFKYDAYSVDFTKIFQLVLGNINEYDAFIKNIISYKGEFEIIKTDMPSFKGLVTVGIAKKQAYIGVSSSINEAMVSLYIKNIRQFIYNNEKLDAFIKSNNTLHEREKHFIEYQAKFKFNIIECYRVYAKIAFNCLAKLKGQEFVLQDKFDNIRNAILTGKNILHYVSTPNSEVAKEISSILKLNKEHFVFFTTEDNVLMGHVTLYGGMSTFGIILSENLSPQDNVNIDSIGYVCDWENKQELTLTEYILNVFIKKQNNESY